MATTDPDPGAHVDADDPAAHEAPVRAAGVHPAEGAALGLGADVTLLVDLERRVVHEVNPSAAAIWFACDGMTTTRDLVRELAAAFGTSEDAIASDVVDALDHMRSIGIIEAAGDAAPVEKARSSDHPRYLTYEPCRCGPPLETWTWAGALAVDLDGTRFAIRHDTEAGGVLLRSALAEAVVDDADVEPVYSLALGDQVSRPVVYEHDRVAASRTDPTELVQWLTAHLRRWRAIGPGGLRLDAAAVVQDGSAVLVERGALFQGAAPWLEELEVASLGPPPVEVHGGTLDGRPILAVVREGASIEQAAPLDALRRLVRSVVPPAPTDRAADDAATAQLVRLAATVPVVSAPLADLAPTVRGLFRLRG